MKFVDSCDFLPKSAERETTSSTVGICNVTQRIFIVLCCLLLIRFLTKNQRLGPEIVRCAYTVELLTLLSETFQPISIRQLQQQIALLNAWSVHNTFKQRMNFWQHCLFQGLERFLIFGDDKSFMRNLSRTTVESGKWERCCIPN